MIDILLLWVDCLTIPKISSTRKSKLQDSSRNWIFLWDLPDLETCINTLQDFLGVYKSCYCNFWQKTPWKQLLTVQSVCVADSVITIITQLHISDIEW